jgi:PAS domain S-box-containing protein
MAHHLTKYTAFIATSCLLITLTGIVVMLGWIYHIDIFTTVKEGYAAMKFNTAFTLVLLSIALLLVIVPVNKAKKRRKIILFSKALTALAFVIGILSLTHFIKEHEININRLLFSHDDAYHGHDFRMSPHTAFCITCTAAAMFWIKAKRIFLRRMGQYLLHATTLVAFIVFIGYLYDVPELHNLTLVSSMAVHTAAAFLIFTIAASFLNPGLGITGIFTGNLIGNLMARRLFFSLLLGILLAGYIRILGHRNAIVSVEFGIALLTVAFCLITLILIWIVSSILNKAYMKLQAAKENLKMVVEAAPYALIMSDKTGKILDFNKRAIKIFGYRENELRGQNVAMLVPENFRNEWMLKRNTFFSAPSIKHYGFDDEIPAIRKNGTVFPIEIVLTPIKTDDGFKILSFVSDITTRKANETIITKQLIELQSKNQELEQFNYISSHDLQEPLRTLLNYIQLLEEDYPDLDQEVIEHLKVMEASVNRMSNVVRSLLDFGRLGRNKKLGLTDCRVIIKEVLSDLKTIIKQNNATITLKDEDEHPKVYAYETELRQLFQNLINNAIKFRKKDVDPHIEISCRRIEGYYEFSVTDNGIGIESKHFEKIFDIFQRLNKETEFEGHGIGLANCKKIAEMHGGKIWVESVPGEGTTFKFTILNFKP